MIEHLAESLLPWICEYGSIALFVLLALGIIALPVPEETLMVLSGILMKAGDLRIIPTVLAAYAGCMTGVTVSYLIGRGLGRYLLKKYGEKLGLNTKMQKLHIWFEKYGRWTLFFGYFVPGVRHFTGFAAGVGEMQYSHFAFFAYIGAFIWSSSFMAIGYFLSDYWILAYEIMAGHIDEILSVLILLLLLYAWVRFKHKAKEEI